MFRVLCGIDAVSVEGTDGGQLILSVFLEASNVTKAFLLMLLAAILVAIVSMQQVYCFLLMLRQSVGIKNIYPKR